MPAEENTFSTERNGYDEGSGERFGRYGSTPDTVPLLSQEQGR